VTLIGGWEEYAFAVNRPRHRRIPEWYYFFRSFSIWERRAPRGADRAPAPEEAGRVLPGDRVGDRDLGRAHAD
jgi:hypothetical protein